MRNMKKVVCIILMALSIGLLNGCTSTEPLSVEEYLKQNNASINLNSIDDFKGLDIFKDLWSDKNTSQYIQFRSWGRD